ncbi:MAG: PepSY domain-containing protein [Pirellulaceae bacterium]|nr:PepSY domain-containing protein [Pirellulaceae bacterium]
MNNPKPPAKGWTDYRAVWRWHFYAGLFTLPFVVVLSISGAIYLFKPQIEGWIDAPYDRQVGSGAAQSASAQVQAALAKLPGATFISYEVPLENTAARVLVRHDGEAIRVYVDPQSLAVLHTVPDGDRFMRQIFRLHGELWMGDRGSNLVELAASWTIIMILTGLYLWWPRNARGWGGILYPRLWGGSRLFWRDLHAVTGIWISTFALLLLISGLPWAKFWRGYFKSVRQLTGTAVARQDWSTGSDRGSRGESGEHSGHSGRRSGGRPAASGGPPIDLAPLDRVLAAVQPLGLAHPVVIAPPGRGSSDWTAKSMLANRPLRENLVIDGQTAEVKSRDGFWEKHPLDRIVAVGIAAHEGQLFGWPNQLLGLLTALGLVLISVSGAILWWRRRDAGVLGAPQVLLSPRVSLGLIALVVLLGLYLPLFGASLVLVLLVEWLVLRRIPAVRDWLGLGAAAPRSAELATAALLIMSIVGCGPRPVAGGTPGTLRAAGELLSEVQITVHQATDGVWQPAGFAVTRSDGSFALVTNGAKGALELSPGEYRCTLESAGAPVQIPPAYTKPETTPLTVAWPTASASLDLEVTVKLLK